MFMWLIIILAIVALVLLFTGKLNALLALCLIIIAILLIPGVSAFLFELFPVALSALGSVGAGSWLGAALALTGAYILHPETVESVIESVGDVAEAVTEEVVDVFNTATTGLLNSPVGIALLGFGAYMLFSTFGAGGSTGLAVLPSDEDEDTSINNEEITSGSITRSTIIREI